MFLRLTDLVGRPVMLNATGIRTIRDHDLGTEWRWTELHMDDGEILRVREEATRIAETVDHCRVTSNWAA